MNLKYRGEIISVTTKTLYPGKFNIGDIVLGPAGILLEVLTVQSDCPVFSKYNPNSSKCVVILETEDHTMLPINGMSGQYNVYRRK